MQKGINSTPSRRLQKLVLLTFLTLAVVYSFSSCTSSVVEKKEIESPFKPLPENIVATDTMENVDFSSFKHDSIRHKDIPCLLCHQQKDEAFRPNFALHTPCAGCHTPQFADKSHQICLVCHTESGSAELKQFPRIKSFTARVNHSAHFKETSCSTCHTPQGSGMAVPSGGDAHATCFQCHTSDKVVGDRNIGSCSTCHEPGTPNRIFDSTKNIGFNFDHSKHGRVSCDKCHNTSSGDGMSAISVSMHKGQGNSCATCHNGRQVFGATGFGDCRRCHQEMPSGKSFGVNFDHSIHATNDCASCHKGIGNGVNFRVPNGTSAHTSCFQCHAPMKGGGAFTSGKCFTCHTPGATNDIRPSRAVIPGNFNHTKHSGLDCASCHNQTGGKMDAPAVAMHNVKSSAMSCASCHNNEMAFGDDFANCKKCHTGGKFGN